MHNIRTLVIVIVSTCLIAVVIAVVWLGGDKQAEHKPPLDQGPVGRGEAGPGSMSSLPREPAPPSALQRSVPESSAVAALLRRWDAVTSQGAEEIKVREVLAQEALDTLGGGAELGAFIEGLHARRAEAMVDWLIARASQAMFGGMEAAATRDWLRGVADGILQGRLLFQAGYYFTGPGLKDYLMSLTPGYAQDRLLTGYCCGLAESDPLRAMREFVELRPAMVTDAGMKEIMRHLPHNADFARIGTLYPDDSTVLPREIRAEMLKRWAQFKPQDAAEHVVANPQVVRPEQLGEVIPQWLDDAPDAVASWVDRLPEGTCKDIGNEEQADYFLPKDPAKAWLFAAKIGNIQERVATAEVIYKVWVERDRPAATAAWNVLFAAPGENS